MSIYKHVSCVCLFQLNGRMLNDSHVTVNIRLIRLEDADLDHSLDIDIGNVVSKFNVLVLSIINDLELVYSFLYRLSIGKFIGSII